MYPSTTAADSFSDYCVEDLLTLREASVVVKRSLASLYRDVKGYDGITLRTVRVKKKRYTTRWWLQEFFSAMTEHTRNELNEVGGARR